MVCTDRKVLVSLGAHLSGPTVQMVGTYIVMSGYIMLDGCEQLYGFEGEGSVHN